MLFFYFGSHCPFFRVMVTLERACGQYSLCLSSLYSCKTTCWVRKVETCRCRKKRKSLEQFLWRELDSCRCMDEVCRGSEKVVELVTQGPMALRLSPERARHPGQRMSTLLCLLARGDVWEGEISCSNVLWNVIGNKPRSDRKCIYSLFNCIILQLLWVVLQQQWGARVQPCCVCAPPKCIRRGDFCSAVSNLN